MLLGSEIGAALTALEPLGIDLIGLNCATGPAEMSEHLRYLARHARVGRCRACPTPACRSSARTARLPADPARARRRPRHVRPRVRARRWSAAAAARRPSTCARSSSGSAAASSPTRATRGPSRAPPRSTSSVPFRQDTSYLAIGERTNANGSKAFREAMLEERWDDCVEIARDQTRDGAHLLDLCVDYVGRDGVGRHARARRPVRHRLDPAARARLHRAAVLEAGLELLGGRRGRQLGQLRGRRRPGVAVRPDHADGPRARRRGRRADHRRGGPGPHRRVEGPGRRAG